MTDAEHYERRESCTCERCRIAGYMGPAVLITLGVLFLIDEFTHFGFGQTWPLLLVVIGLVRMLQWTAPTTGHRSSETAAPAAPPEVPHE